MMGQFCKQMLIIHRWRQLFLAGIAGFFASLMFVTQILGATGSVVTIVVTDPLSGVAINGYDPVSYFIETQPLPGQPEFEYFWNGVPWFFANAANRDVFARAPEIYAPQFGGHGTMGLARGFLADGNPRIYAVLAQRLFLFYSTGNRDAFMLAQRGAYSQAVQNWEILSVELIGPADK